MRSYYKQLLKDKRDLYIWVIVTCFGLIWVNFELKFPLGFSLLMVAIYFYYAYRVATSMQKYDKYKDVEMDEDGKA